MRGDTVWVLLLNHKHGTDYSVHDSEKSAMMALADYCREWWDEAMERRDDERLAPDADNEVIAEYFEVMDDETYEIGCRKVMIRSSNRYC